MRENLFTPAIDGAFSSDVNKDKPKRKRTRKFGKKSGHEYLKICIQ